MRERIDQLNVEYRERVGVDLDSLTELLREDRRLAHRLGQAGAAVSATEKIAKIHGYMKERISVDVNVSVSQMKDAEIDAELDKIEREDIRLSGRKGIEEGIARLKQRLIRFDNGEFDDILPPDLARAPKATPVLVLPVSEFQSTPAEE